MTKSKEVISEDVQDLLKQISMDVSHVLSKIIEDSPLTAHQMYIMKIIRKNPKYNLTALCKELNLSKGSMSIMINKLVDEGYVSRMENAIDRRNIELVLTKKGEKILDDTIEQCRQIFIVLTSKLSVDELVDIRTNLIKLSVSIQSAIDNEGSGCLENFDEVCEHEQRKQKC